MAVKRVGAIDDLTREFAREHSERLWKQLVLAGADGEDDHDSRAWGSSSLWVALTLALAAAVAVNAFPFPGGHPPPTPRS